MINKLQLALLLSLTSIPVYAAGANKKPIEYEVKSFTLEKKDQGKGTIVVEHNSFLFIPMDKKKESHYFILNENFLEREHDLVSLSAQCYDKNNKHIGGGDVRIKLKNRFKASLFLDALKEWLEKEIENKYRNNNGEGDKDEMEISIKKHNTLYSLLTFRKIEPGVSKLRSMMNFKTYNKTKQTFRIKTPREIEFKENYMVLKRIEDNGFKFTVPIISSKKDIEDNGFKFTVPRQPIISEKLQGHVDSWCIALKNVQVYDHDGKEIDTANIVLAFSSKAEKEDFAHNLQCFINKTNKNLQNPTQTTNNDNIDGSDNPNVDKQRLQEEIDSLETQIKTAKEEIKQKIQEVVEENKKLQEEIDSVETQIKKNQDTTNDKLKNLLVTKLGGEIQNNTTTDTVGLINLIGKGVSSLSEKASRSAVDMNALHATKEKIEKIIANTRELDQRAKQYEDSIHTFIKKNVADNNGVERDLKGRGLIKKLNTIQIPAENKAKHSHRFVVVSSLVALIIGCLTTIGGKYLIDFLQKKSKNFEETDLQNKEEETEEFFI